MKTNLLSTNGFLYLRHSKEFLFSLLLLVISLNLSGQYIITNTGSTNTYTQNFDSFTGTTATLPTGWSLSAAPNGFYNRNTYNNGNDLYAMRDTSSSADRSVGGKVAANSGNCSSTGTRTITLQVKNSTGANITGFVVTWKVEQYSTGGRAATLNMTHGFGGTTTGTTTFTSTTGSEAATASILQTSRNITISGITLANNATGTFTFTICTGSGSGNNGHVGLDDFTLYANAAAVTPAVTLANNGTQIAAGDVTQGTAKHPVSSFQLSATSAAATLTEAFFTTDGTYRAVDITGFKLWYNTTNNLSSATQIGAAFVPVSTGSGDLLEFTDLSQQIALSATRYFWVTADIASGATLGRTVRVEAIANADLTFSSGTKSGLASIAGVQTITSNNFTLTYNGNDNTSNASTVPDSVSFVGGQNPGVLLANPTTLVKDGYELASWYTITNGVSGGVSNTPGSNYGPAPMPSADITIYARWRFAVAYNSNGGTGSVTGQTSYYNGTAGVKSGTVVLSGGGALSRSGYTFGGWKTTAEATAADYAAGVTYTHSGANATRVLYAHWIANPPKLTVTPAALSGFTYSVSNGPSDVKSFALSGSDLQGTDTDPVELVTIDDHFEISESAAGPWSHAIELPSAYIGASKTIYVRMKEGLTAGNYTDTVLVSGGSVVEASFAEVSLSGTVTSCLAPTAQSVVSSFGTIGINGMTINLTSGNGVGRIVKINTSNSFTNPTNDSTLPTANAVYAGSGEQVIYAGSGSNVAVTGLSHSTTYWYRVYEYNICSGNYTYNTTTITNNPRSQATICDVPATPNGDIELDNPYCGSAALFYELSDPKQEGVTYYWQTILGGVSTANPVVFMAGAEISEPYTVTVGGYYYVRAYNGNCWSAASYRTQDQVIVMTSADINTQPVDQNVVSGTNASFTVIASGTAPFTYQWQESSTGLAGSWINVGNTAALNLASVPLSKNGYKYRVIVSNGCGSTTSSVVTLTVVSGPCFEETFNTITAGNSTSTGGSSSAWSGNTNFPITSTTYQAGGAVRIGTTVSGRITSRALSEVSGNIKVELDMKGWTTVEGSFNITIAGVTKNITYTNTMADGFETKVVTFENVPVGSQLIIETTRRSFLDAVRVYCTPDCTPAVITPFPVTGPAGTIVTITGSNFTSNSTVKFGNASATVEYISSTQLKAIVPATADGNISVKTTLACESEAVFTLIKEDVTDCEPLTGASPGGTYASDLIIYEIYDENGGTGGSISIYNGTNTTVDLSNYDIYRASDYGGNYLDYATMSGSLAPGAVALLGAPSSKCGYTPTHGTINGGYNDNDGFRLIKGSVVIDDVRTPNYSGYYMKRKNEYLNPNLTFNDAQWTTESLIIAQCLPVAQIGRVPGVRTSPIINSQPAYSLSCDVINASLTLTATEGLPDGNALAYQWFVLGESGSWTAITDGGVYFGATTPTLSINDIAGLNNNQYYCEVRESTQTCYTATNATQVKEASTTWAGNLWSNGAPVLGNKVIIAGNYDTQANGILDVCNLTVNAGGSIRIKPNYPITVKNKIINNNINNADAFIVESDANLIQTESIANEGVVKVERSVTGMNNVAGAIDYVYWSSPVSGQAIKGPTGFSPNTPATGYMQYNESNDRFVVTSDQNFLTGKGYAIRAENVLPNPYSKIYSFAGIPNNGDVSSPILNKTAGADKGYNLIGNPYPSNIDFDLFHSINDSKIYATAFLWTNNLYEPQQMGSGYAGNNYAIYNITGGVPATYDEGNTSYSAAPNGKIKVGQGFIVQSKIAGVLDFKNSIRITDDGTFYQKKSAKNRFWLTMKSPNNLINTILVGYVPGATNNYETDFDGELLAVGSDSFYSVLGAKKLAIQGRVENFSVEDVVALGNVFSVNGTYTIKLRSPEGYFDNNQKIYLRDKILNKYINLTAVESYTFEAVKGTDNTRFEIVYKDGTLTMNETKKSEFLVYRDGEDFVIRSSNKLGRVEVFDISGRLMKSFTTHQASTRINVSNFSSGIFIIKAENSGDVRTRKINK